MTLKGDATAALAKACDPSSCVEMGYLCTLSDDHNKGGSHAGCGSASWTVDEPATHRLQPSSDGCTCWTGSGWAVRARSDQPRRFSEPRTASSRTPEARHAAMALMQGSAAIGAHAVTRGKHHEVDGRQEVLTLARIDP